MPQVVGGEIGDLAWMICTALMGAYFAMTSIVELVLIPYLSTDYAAFLTYRPSPIEVVNNAKATDVVSSVPWAPFGGSALTLIGLLTQLACCNKMMRNRKRQEVPLVQP